MKHERAGEEAYGRPLVAFDTLTGSDVDGSGSARVTSVPLRPAWGITPPG